MDSNDRYGLPYHAVSVCTKTPVPPKNPFETFGCRGSRNRPNTVSTDRLGYAPPTRAGNQAQFWPGSSKIHLCYQIFNSRRRTMDSNDRYGLPYHAVSVCTKTPVLPKNPFETFGCRGSRNRPNTVSTDRLGYAPPTRAGNQAQFWPGSSNIHLCYQILNSWRI
jgi:hypothetical protein